MGQWQRRDISSSENSLDKTRVDRSCTCRSVSKRLVTETQLSPVAVQVRYEYKNSDENMFDENAEENPMDKRRRRERIGHEEERPEIIKQAIVVKAT